MRDARPARFRAAIFTVIAVFAASLGFASFASAAPGDLARSFSGDGWTALAPSQDLPTRFADVAGEANGDMVAVGSTSAPSNVPNPAYADNAIIARFTPGGALDPSFGDGGRVTVDLGAEDRALAVAVQPDGRIL